MITRNVLVFVLLVSALTTEAAAQVSIGGHSSNGIGPFAFSGTVQGNDVLLEVNAGGGASSNGHSVVLTLGGQIQNIRMQRSLSASGSPPGASFQDPNPIPIATDVATATSAGMNPCQFGSWYGAQTTSCSTHLDAVSPTISVIAFTYGEYGSIPLGCPASVPTQGYYVIRIYFDAPTPVAFTATGTSFVPPIIGSSQATPHLPHSTGQSGGGVQFAMPTNGHWFDPPAVAGYVFSCGPGGAFSKIDSLPVGIDSDQSFLVQTPCGSYVVGEGLGIDFMAACGSTVPWFIVVGIDVTDNYGSPLGFPIELSFSGTPAFFDMTPLDDAPSNVLCTGDGTGAPCPCGNTGSIGNGCASSFAPGGAHLSVTGTASVSFDGALLTAFDVSNSYVLFFQGDVAANGGLGIPVGDGLKCAAGTTRRLGTAAAHAGVAHFPPAGSLLSTIGNIPFGGGVSRVYQGWYRNPAQFCQPETFNFTNGLQLVWEP